MGRGGGERRGKRRRGKKGRRRGKRRSIEEWEKEKNPATLPSPLPRVSGLFPYPR